MCRAFYDVVLFYYVGFFYIVDSHVLRELLKNLKIQVATAGRLQIVSENNFCLYDFFVRFLEATGSARMGADNQGFPL